MCVSKLYVQFSALYELLNSETRTIQMQLYENHPHTHWKSFCNLFSHIQRIADALNLELINFTQRPLSWEIIAPLPLTSVQYPNWKPFALADGMLLIPFFPISSVPLSGNKCTLDSWWFVFYTMSPRANSSPGTLINSPRARSFVSLLWARMTPKQSFNLEHLQILFDSTQRNLSSNYQKH